MVTSCTDRVADTAPRINSEMLDGEGRQPETRQLRRLVYTSGGLEVRVVAI